MYISLQYYNYILLYISIHICTFRTICCVPWSSTRSGKAKKREIWGRRRRISECSRSSSSGGGSGGDSGDGDKKVQMPFTTYNGPSNTSTSSSTSSSTRDVKVSRVGTGTGTGVEIPLIVRDVLTSTASHSCSRSGVDSNDMDISTGTGSSTDIGTDTGVVLQQLQQYLYTDDDAALLKVKSLLNKHGELVEPSTVNSTTSHSVTGTVSGPRSLNVHVITPYGMGILATDHRDGVGDDIGRSTGVGIGIGIGMVRVCLPWGVGTFRSDCVDKIQTVTKSNSRVRKGSIGSSTSTGGGAGGGSSRARGSSMFDDEEEGSGDDANPNEVRTLRSRSERTPRCASVSYAEARPVTSRSTTPSNSNNNSSSSGTSASASAIAAKRAMTSKLMKFAKQVAEEKGSQVSGSISSGVSVCFIVWYCVCVCSSKDCLHGICSRVLCLHLYTLIYVHSFISSNHYIYYIYYIYYTITI